MTKETEPRVLSDAELDHVHGGGLQTVHEAPGSGNVVPGGGGGLDTETVTSGNGNAPPGKNK
jgi:hypothetical protein